MDSIMSKTTLKIEFDNSEAAMHFATWLCESGEQSYWNWMEYREEEENGPITATSFDYHTIEVDASGKQTYTGFVKDWTIKAECGRMFFGEDEPEE